MESPHDRILELAEKVRQYKASGRDKSLSERDTMNALVQPLLQIAGWDIHDPDQVASEEKFAELPADYALKLEGKVKIIVECKRLSNKLDSPKDLAQALAYSAGAGVKWCVLTNGALVQIYNSLAPEVATEKRLEELDLAKVGTAEGVQTDKALQILRIISPQSVRSGEIDRVWDSRYASEKIRATVEALLSGPDPEFASLVRRRMKEHGQPLSNKETAEWLNALDIKVHAPVQPLYGGAQVVPTRRDTTAVIQAPRKMRIGGDSLEVRYSYEILTRTADWLIARGKLTTSDCPVAIGRKRFLVNIEPKHTHGDDFRAPKKLSNGLWIEVHYSTRGCIRNARRLLERFGYPGSTLQVQ